MSIYIIAAGKLSNDKHIVQQINVYLQRMHFFKCIIHEVADKNLIQEHLNAKLYALIPKGAYVVMLDEKGSQFTTEQFTTWFQGNLMNYKHIVFLIAGADGWLNHNYQWADLKLSLAKFTLSHPLARLVLVEQLYRVQSLLNNHPYHRA